MAKTSNGTTNVCYPIFDGRGNMVSTLTYSGSSFSLANQRSYDAWGNIRGGSSGGDPKGRYCANLGHKQDDESDLTYMRARYYDPSLGRFTSEDASRDGLNWFAYASDNPVRNADASGNAAFPWLDSICFLMGVIFGILGLMQVGDPYVLFGLATVGGAIPVAKAVVKYTMDIIAEAEERDAAVRQAIREANQALNSLAAEAAENSIAAVALNAIAFETGELEGAMIELDIEVDGAGPEE